MVELEHKNLIAKIDSFSQLNFQPAESEYLDDQNKPRKCYLLDKRECRIIAATESKAITVLLIDYLEQLEAIFEKAQEAKVKELDRKLSKNGITWREACRIAGIHHPDLAKRYMVKRGHFKEDSITGALTLSKLIIEAGLFKYVQTQGRNPEGFRVLTKGYEMLCQSAEAINWKCLKYSQSPKHKTIYERHFAEYMKDYPEEFDAFGVWLRPQW